VILSRIPDAPSEGRQCCGSSEGRKETGKSRSNKHHLARGRSAADGTGTLRPERQGVHHRQLRQRWFPCPILGQDQWLEGSATRLGLGCSADGRRHPAVTAGPASARPTRVTHPAHANIADGPPRGCVTQPTRSGSFRFL